MLDKHCGAEWWNKQNKEAAINLHYDKDEELASTFALGQFPTLSTVTYLTGNTIRSSSSDERVDDGDSGVGTSVVVVAPTLVFAHTYDMPDYGRHHPKSSTNTTALTHQPRTSRQTFSI